jgi:hypothetical protein
VRVIRATTRRCLRETYSDGTTECRSGGNGTPRSRASRRRTRSPSSRTYHRARGTSQEERRPPCGRHEASRGGRAFCAGRLCRGARRNYSHAACLPIYAKITGFGPISLARARRVSGRRQTFRGGTCRNGTSERGGDLRAIRLDRGSLNVVDAVVGAAFAEPSVRLLSCDVSASASARPTALNRPHRPEA